MFGYSLGGNNCAEPMNPYDALNVCCKVGNITTTESKICYTTFCSLYMFQYAKEEYVEPEPSTTETTSTTTSTTVAPRRDDLDGCELEGREICAHKCIPNGKSYKCQCKPGFDLRPDGVSCQKKLSEM
jgi:hypothetical protein